MRFVSDAWCGFGLVCLALVQGCGSDKAPVDVVTDTEADAATSAPPVRTAPKPSAAVSVDPDAGSVVDGQAPSMPTGVISFGDSGTTLEWTGKGPKCGASLCSGAVIAGVVQFNLKGCCADDDVCGLDLSQIGFLVGLSDGGCEILDRPGSAAAECPASDPIRAPAISSDLVLEPCCQADGKCGYVADFTGLGFGCVQPERFGQTSAQSCTYAP